MGWELAWTNKDTWEFEGQSIFAKVSDAWRPLAGVDGGSHTVEPLRRWAG